MLTGDGLPKPIDEAIDGLSLSSRRTGNGPVALLLHGIGSGSGSFWAQFDAFGASFSLVAWDAPGYGRSSDPEGTFGLEDFARTAAALMRAITSEPAHVVGVSWGGVIATRLALRYPKLVDTLTLISSSVGRRANPDVHRGFAERARALRTEGVDRWAKDRVSRQVSSSASQELKSRIVATARESVRPTGFELAAASLIGTDHSAGLERITAPTLVLVGDEDPITGLAESRRLAEGIPGARLVSVPGGGHLLNQDTPDVVNAELLGHWGTLAM